MKFKNKQNKKPQYMFILCLMPVESRDWGRFDLFINYFIFKKVCI